MQQLYHSVHRNYLGIILFGKLFSINVVYKKMPCLSLSMDDFNEIQIKKSYTLHPDMLKKDGKENIDPTSVTYDIEEYQPPTQIETSNHDSVLPAIPEQVMNDDDDATTEDETLSENSTEVTEQNLEAYLHKLIQEEMPEKKHEDVVCNKKTTKAFSLLGGKCTNKIAAAMNFSQKTVINAVEDAKIKRGMNLQRQANIPTKIFSMNRCLFLPMFFGKKK
jgi:hypothetical protein